MRRLKSFAQVLLILIIFIMVLGFVLENQQAVTLFFGGWVAPQAPASFYIVGALIVGMVTGPVLSLLVRRRHE